MSEPTYIVQVPASTSNCGPGFDTLSFALSLCNFLKIKRVEKPEVYVSSDRVDCGETQAMVEEVIRVFSERSGKEFFGVEVEIWGEVPVARGLGSSAIIRSGTLAGLNKIVGEPLSKDELIEIATVLDHAPDNVAACFYGGFCISRLDPKSGSYLDTIRFEISDELSMVVVSPDVEVLTVDAREALPTELPFKDVVRSLNSLAYLVGIMATGDYKRLSHAVTDFIHQPYRERICPFVHEAIRAGREAGAYTGWLSGSGSSILCVCESKLAIEVGKAMDTVFQSNGVQSRVFRTKVDNIGLTIEPAS